ncbi:MAG TPA: MBOAT family O-acyltransferase [Chitinophagaceae bacterium]|nr:MBOAT family O-acyltransferase [Chitinophagaceae bacterium]
MSFTSIAFLPLLLISLVAYYVYTQKASIQNLVLLVTSLIFYGYGHIQYLAIWAGISSFTFLSGLFIQQSIGKKWLKAFISIVSIVLFFLFIKYANMFSSILGLHLSSSMEAFQLLLPIGLSFYSFSCIGYLADVYNQRILACKQPLNWFAYSSFFPQLLSGPIAFADEQLPQFENPRKFNLQNMREAIPYLVWGLFKKVVISSLLMKPVAYIFAQHENLHGITLLMGLFFYSIQIYADFSGYSDMAYGIARMFGIELQMNFHMPYFSPNIKVYWRRWHASLSKWFGRYVFAPIGGSQGKILFLIRNIMIVFAISGLWHGTDMKFVLWGVLNGLFYVAYIVYEKYKTSFSTIKHNLVLNGFSLSLGGLLTFLAVMIARVYFRSSSIQEANQYMLDMFNHDGIGYSIFGLKFLLPVFAFMLFEWLQRNQMYALDFKPRQLVFKYTSYIVVLACIVYAMQQPQTTEHIYFKF